MTRDDVFDLAREAGLIRSERDPRMRDLKPMQRFAARLVAEEREQCAKLMEKEGPNRMIAGFYAARLIRERGAA